ncbi:hypothetical protein B296_00029898 [Ensete ventricosum]|uniref:Uncharacterized protein n=1 Tax=Ensete ventricosum TaxID=4639 RepID=A0A426ZKN9_ENSVE|nr:hypothetical protein B296_00029898 [Ensete ventricosum]
MGLAIAGMTSCLIGVILGLRHPDCRGGSPCVERFRERPRQPLPRHIPFSASMDSRGVEAGVNPADGRRPDIYELFCHYNALYFRDALGTCALSWASSSPYPR